METKLNVKILSHTINPELTIATGGKLCYSSSNIDDLVAKQTDESVERFIKMITDIGHGSVLEHCSFTFGIEGVSRSLTHQLCRHRIASYSQQSQRYVKENQFEYVVPDDIKKHHVLKELYIRQMEQQQETYDELTTGLICMYLTAKEYEDYLKLQLKKLKINEDEFRGFIQSLMTDAENITVDELVEMLRDKYKRLYSTLEKKAIENARYVLPNACETKIIVTMNLRSLINFCHHRCCRRAQDEINQLAWSMVEEVEKISPLLAKCLGASCQFGACPEKSMTCGRAYPKKK